MKVLFSTDPWIYRDSAGNQLFTIVNVIAKAVSGLVMFGNDVKILVGEDTYYCLKKNNIKLACKVICIPLNELYAVFENHYIAHSIQYHGTENNEQRKKTKLIVEEYAKGWKPDVVISFTTPCSVWNYVFPEALSLQLENGIFSRTPYPFTCQLDPFGFLKQTYPSKFRNQLRGKIVDRREKELILDFISKYRINIFERYNPIRKEDCVNPKYKHTVLVPLSYNGVVINDAASKYRSQLDYLVYILEHISSDIAIIATRHSLQLNGSIPKETEEFLLSKYKNLSFMYQYEQYAFLSQWLTPHVDAVISLNSTIAFHAAMLGKKVFALGDCEINAVADSEDLNNINEILAGNDEEIYDEKLSVIYELLTRHSFSITLMHDGEWLTNRLSSLVKVYQRCGFYDDYKCLPKLMKKDEDIFECLLKNTPGLANDFVPRIRTIK